MSLNKKNISILLLFMVLSLIYHQLTAQSFAINNGKKRTAFNFELINNLVVVPVTLNGNTTLRFILDTGVRSTLLTNRSGQLIRPEDAQSVQVAGAGQNRNIKAYLVKDVTVSLPGITGSNMNIVVLEEDYLELSTHLGTEVHGILGYDFFSSFAVRIDYTNKRIIVFDKDHFRPRKRDTPLAIRIEQGRPYAQATLKQYHNEPMAVSLLIDSGASHSLMLERDSDERIELPEKTIETIVGWGLGGELSGHLGRIESFEMAGFQFDNMLSSFTENYSDPRLFDRIGRRGSIGGELLSRYTTTYDYKNNKLYLRKNYHFKRHFEFNLSGIDLVAEGPNFKTFRVIHVIKGSTAEAAGLMTGDIILRINGNYAAKTNLSEINSTLRLRPGHRIDLLVYRQGEFETIRFKLQRLI